MRFRVLLTSMSGNLVSAESVHFEVKNQTYRLNRRPDPHTSLTDTVQEGTEALSSSETIFTSELYTRRLNESARVRLSGARRTVGHQSLPILMYMSVFVT